MKPIMISYTLAASQQMIEVPILYDTVQNGNLLTLFCAIQQIKEYPVPPWLRPFKFEVKLVANGKAYDTLYADHNAHNLDSTLFIDKAAESILLYESSLPLPTKPAGRKKAVVAG